MTEVEIQLRFDKDGRTIASEEFYAKNPHLSSEEKNMDYSSKTTQTLIQENIESEFYDNLLLDCEITDCALLPRTFWMPSDGKPRFALEQMALEVFRHHVKGDIVYDPTTSGAEYWVQIRPSPPAGRYNLLGKEDVDEKKSVNEKSNGDEDDVDLESEGICFHWDKDEDLRLMMGGNVYVHPHISTVTYLSSIGAPTMALNYRVNPLTGEYIETTDDEWIESYVSWPKKGKHLSFDGRYLHAAPSNLMPEGEFKKQTTVKNDITDENELKKQVRRHRRVTFLVNIWLNFKPFNVELFPESMTDKMTKANLDEVPAILFNDANTSAIDAKVKSIGNSTTDTTHFKWPMGGFGSKEYITMELPLEAIQGEMEIGGNLQVRWNCDDGISTKIKLFKDIEDKEQDIKKQKIA